MRAPWATLQDVLFRADATAPVLHLRAYRRADHEHAVVLGELSDQERGLFAELPRLWELLADHVDVEAARIFSFCPVAADPFRRHASAFDVAGDRVPVHPTAAPPQDPTSAGRWRLGDGPTVDVWPASRYTTSVLAQRPRRTTSRLDLRPQPSTTTAAGPRAAPRTPTSS